MYHMAYLKDEQVYFYAPSPYVWQCAENAPANLTDIAITQGGELFALCTDGYIYEYNKAGKAWKRESGQASGISAVAYYVPNNWLLAVAADGTLWYCDLYAPPADRHWAETQHKHISEAAASLVWEYVVQPGDWLFKIVRTQYGTTNEFTKTSTLVGQIVGLNPGIIPDRLEVGQRLRMPPKG